MHEVTIKVTVFNEDREMAKIEALDYLHQITEIKDSEIVPIKEEK